MLRGGSREVKIGGLWEKLDFEKEQLIYQPATMLRAGVCEYCWVSRSYGASCIWG